MKKLLNQLASSFLFRGYGDCELHRLLENMRYRVAQFSSDQIIALEHAPCSHMGILLEGEAEVQKSFASGKVVSVSRLQAGEVFGEAMVFSDKEHYPATIMAAADPTRVMFISHQQVHALCQADMTFYRRFAGLLSHKLLMLSEKVRLLTYPSVRQKVIAYLLALYEEQGENEVILPVSRQIMAQQLGIPRPSVSRELVRLRQDGFLEFHRQVVILKDVEGMIEQLRS